MEIRTQITREDLVALEWFNLLRSGNARYQLLFWAVVPPLAASGIPLWLTAGHLSSLVRLSFLLIVPVYMVLFYRGTRGRLARNLDDSCHTAQTQRELGDYSILLADEGIHIAHEAETRFLAWTDILRVIVNSSHGFIYTAENQALIIPQRCFPQENEFALFMKMAVIYHWNNQPTTTGQAEDDQSPSALAGAPALPAKKAAGASTLRLTTSAPPIAIREAKEGE